MKKIPTGVGNLGMYCLVSEFSMKTKYENISHVLNSFWIKKGLGIRFKLLEIICYLDVFGNKFFLPMNWITFHASFPLAMKISF